MGVAICYRCGYVLMPDCLLQQEGFNPHKSTTHKTDPINMVISVNQNNNYNKINAKYTKVK